MAEIYTRNVGKIKGVPLINKLRIIQLIEADLNAVLKYKIGHQLMRLKSTNKILGDDMHGGRPKRSTTDALMTKTLLTDLAIQQQKAATIINLDASKFFDRIYPHVGNIGLRRLGAPKNLCISVNRTQRMMEHRVRTAYGISEKSIQARNEESWSGVGQGSGASSPMWIANQSIMLKAR